MNLLRHLRIARKIADIFPEGCETGNELDWMLKGNCPACVAEPLEHTSILEYRMKHPARNTLTVGMVKLNLCDYHLEQLHNRLEQVMTKVNLVM